MLNGVAHATLSLRCIKVSREKSCNEQVLAGRLGVLGEGRLLNRLLHAGRLGHDCNVSFKKLVTKIKVSTIL